MLRTTLILTSTESWRRFYGKSTRIQLVFREVDVAEEWIRTRIEVNFGSVFKSTVKRRDIDLVYRHKLRNLSKNNNDFSLAINLQERPDLPICRFSKFSRRSKRTLPPLPAVQSFIWWSALVNLLRRVTSSKFCKFSMKWGQITSIETR